MILKFINRNGVMFHFGKKEGKVRDKVWINEKIKWEYCKQQFQKQKQTAFVAWFEETYEKLAAVFSASGLPVDTIFLTRQALHHQLQNVPVLFVEHYPLRSKEKEFFEKHHLGDITICSSLDEPLLKHFGSDKIVSMLNQTGLNESEPLEHKLITSAIKNAQDKIESQVTLEMITYSQADWLMKNLTA